MKRRLFALLACMLLLCPLARAETLPSKTCFSVGLESLENSLRQGESVRWGFRMAPETLGGFAEGAMEALCAMVSELSLEGVVQARSDGGWMEVRLLSGGSEAGVLRQITEESGVASLWLDGRWYADSLLQPNYGALAEGRIPFVTLIQEEGARLWGLASPWSADNNRISVPSGPTSHGITYTIDTETLRTILTEWLDTLEVDMDDLPGVEEAWVKGLLAKMYQFAYRAELSKPLEANLAFGMGDVLRTARLRGTVELDGKRDGVSYSYSCTESNTRITRKYSLDFEPRVGDTLVFSCTWLTSCSGSGRAAREITISASGKYNGESYRIKWTSEMLNRYAQGEDGGLTELLTGTVSASLRYAGETLLDVSLKRSGEVVLPEGGTPAYTDTYTGSIESREETLFEGTLTFDASVAGDVEAPAAPGLEERLAEGEAQALESALSRLRAGMMVGLSEETIQALLSAY